MSIAIVGTGISGLQLALRLQSLDIETVLYSPLSIDEHRNGRLPNCVMRWAPTVERERELGVYNWETNAVPAGHVRVQSDPPIAFTGRFNGPANTTDFRLYLPRLMEDYVERGGRLVVGPVAPAQLGLLTDEHHLIIVAAGRDGFGGVFSRDESRSPNAGPRRFITAGLYRGVAWPEPSGVEFTIVPGVGEIFQISFHSFDGPVSAIAFEGIPGSPLADIVDRDYAADPRLFEQRALQLIGEFAPALRERVDDPAFGLTRPLDLLQGRLAPVVRQSWARVSDDRYAIAIGDAWILNDPIAAQGANLGSRCAFVLAEAIAEDGPYDEAFCRTAAERLWAVAEAPTILSNAFLEPPPRHVIDVLVRAAQDEDVADAFVSGFGEPERFLGMLSPEPALS